MSRTKVLRRICAALAFAGIALLSRPAAAQETDGTAYNAMMIELAPEERDGFSRLISAQPQPARQAIYDVSDALQPYEHGIWAALLVEYADGQGGPSLVDFILALDKPERARLAGLLSERQSWSWAALPVFLRQRPIEEARFATLQLPDLQQDAAFDADAQIDLFCRPTGEAGERPVRIMSGDECLKAWDDFLVRWEPPRSVRVVRGDMAGRNGTENAWWQLQLHQKGRPVDWAKSHICGAVYIGEKWALTAAHCVADFWPTDFGRVDIRYALHDLTIAGSSVEIAAIVKHAGHTRSGDSGDIALLKLAAVPASRELKAAGVPDREAARAGYPPNAALLVSGWGYTGETDRTSNPKDKFGKPQQTSRNLLVGEVNYLPAAECGPLLRAGAVKPGQMCAYSAGQVDSCRGDSGGPLVRKAGSQPPVLVGLVSFGEGCGQAGKPGVYADVGFYERNGWIDSAKRKALGIDRQIVDLGDPVPAARR
ncbi:trypsin-like serine protease [Altererythrobacter salegens]|uniref:Trypsin-like serine protease n=1 Tax=Croceibacterium salegens TaxID=1737568 RepID=A0A6I4SZJ6_9SPHN|nr:serine protease [Croceibacterium salegens]MXO60467.1 trypsin-like serine protease [Croceibacterium salegens]